jgi:anaerobic carbon-monoxide dehydrogenase iron sulfur subunit
MESAAVDDKKTLIIDSEICSGCKICEIACSLAHDSRDISGGLSMIKIKDNPQKGIYVPVACGFCENAPCLDACPLHALFLDEKTGVVRVDLEECVGCGLCADSCSFKAIKIHPENNIAIVCDLCGGEPECVKYCTQKAISYK